MKGKIGLLAGMAALLMDIDRELRVIDVKHNIKTNNLGGVRNSNVKSETHDSPKTKKRRAKNKAAKKSRKKNRK